MTYLDAAHVVLIQAGEPLHYAEITRRALAQDLIQPSGLTPEATMGSRLYTATKQAGTQFMRVGRGIFALVGRQPSGIDAQVQRINQETRAQLRELLHTMPPDRFEALIMDLLLQMGFDESTVAVTPYRSDGGIDVTGIYRAAGLTEVNAAVQVKRWKGNVRAPAVTQLRGSLQVHQQGIIITTSDYSRGARKEAAASNKTRIGLINGDELIELLIKHEVGVQEKTLRVVGLDDEWWGELLDVATDTLPVADTPLSDDPSMPGQTSRSTTQSTLLTTQLPAAGADPTGHKPHSLSLLGETYAVTSWKEVLLVVAHAMACRHPQTFASQAAELRGRKRAYVSPDPIGMFKPQQIPNTELWLETNLSAKDILKMSRRLLATFDEDPAGLELTYE